MSNLTINHFETIYRGDEAVAELLLGDTLERIKDIANGQVDCIITDLPYGTTQCSWDSVIPFEPLWAEFNRIKKPNAPVILFSAGIFSATVVMSNPGSYKYEIIWEKSKASGHLNSKKMPMRAHENIHVFYDRPCTYNAQMVEGTPYDKGTAVRPTDVYGAQAETHVINTTGLRWPRSVQYFKTAESEKGKGRGYPIILDDDGNPILDQHGKKKKNSTQKPVELMSWLIKTFSNPGDTIFDATMGTGTTGVAAVELNRNFIGIDLDKDFVKAAKQRIQEVI